MAIVFVSAQKKQRMVFWIIIAVSILIVVAIGGIVFLPDFLNNNTSVPPSIAPAPSININFSVLDSDSVKNLILIESPPKRFTYAGQDKVGKLVQGDILSVSQDKAQSDLEQQGYKITSLKESIAGRDNPFVPYY